MKRERPVRTFYVSVRTVVLSRLQKPFCLFLRQKIKHRRMMEATHFQRLKDICIRACHERKACAEGYRQMLAAQNVSQMMAVWRANWDDVVTGKFVQTITSSLPALYPYIREEMNAAGIYLNECPQRIKPNVLVIVTGGTAAEPVEIYALAQAYVTDTACVVAHGHSQVYNTSADRAQIVLHDRAYCSAESGMVEARDNSSLRCTGTCRAFLYGSAVCRAAGGAVHVFSCESLVAEGSTQVFRHSPCSRITISSPDVQLTIL